MTDFVRPLAWDDPDWQTRPMIRPAGYSSCCNHPIWLLEDDLEGAKREVLAAFERNGLKPPSRLLG